MSNTKDLFTEATDAASAVVAGAAGSSLDPPTPCADWTVRDLIDHWAGTTAAMARIGDGDALDPDDPWGTNQSASEVDWGAELQANLAAMAAGWSTDDPWQGTVQAGDQEMPAPMIGDMAFVEALLHAWDLARATGQQFAVADPVAAELRRILAETGEMGRNMGAYGDEIVVEGDDMAWALGQAGRNPAWSPAG